MFSSLQINSLSSFDFEYLSLAGCVHVCLSARSSVRLCVSFASVLGFPITYPVHRASTGPAALACGALNAPFLICKLLCGVCALQTGDGEVALFITWIISFSS